jgi:hypothetical protein
MVLAANKTLITLFASTLFNERFSNSVGNSLIKLNGVLGVLGVLVGDNLGISSIYIYYLYFLFILSSFHIL